MRKYLHIFADFIVGDSSVNLRCLDIGVSQHLRNRFDRNSFTKCHCRGKSMPGQMERNVLIDIAEVCNLLQVAVQLLIGNDR